MLLLALLAFVAVPVGAKVGPVKPPCTVPTVKLSEKGITMTGLEMNDRIVLTITLSGMSRPKGTFALNDAFMPFQLKDGCNFSAFGSNVKKLVFTETDLETLDTRGIEGTGTNSVSIGIEGVSCPCTAGKKKFSVYYETVNPKKASWISMSWEGVVKEDKKSFTVPFTISANTKGTAYVSLVIDKKCGKFPFIQSINIR